MEGDFGQGFLDNPTNTEPNDWMNSRNWGSPHHSQLLVRTVPVAAVAETADGVRGDNSSTSGRTCVEFLNNAHWTALWMNALLAQKQDEVVNVGSCWPSVQ